MLIKNKLLKLANHFAIFVAASFNVEQIVDSIVEQVTNKRPFVKGYVPPELPPAQEEDRSRLAKFIKGDQPHILPRSSSNEGTTKDQAFRPGILREERSKSEENTRGRQKEVGRKEESPDKASRSKSKSRVDKLISEYERDLESIEKGKLKFNRFEEGSRASLEQDMHQQYEHKSKTDIDSRSTKNHEAARSRGESQKSRQGSSNEGKYNGPRKNIIRADQDELVVQKRPDSAFQSRDIHQQPSRNYIQRP